MTNLIIQIPITTDCDPSTLLDLAIELGEQVAEEATRYGSVYGEAAVDEQEILVRPAGLTSLERKLLAALEEMCAAPLGERATPRALLAARQAIKTAKAGGAK